jgi:hypothetical protein
MKPIRSSVSLLLATLLTTLHDSSTTPPSAPKYGDDEHSFTLRGMCNIFGAL